MTTDKLAHEILAHIGGSDNIKMLTHCATRLRVVLISPRLAKQDKLEALAGVEMVFWWGEQLQLLIGATVDELYQVILGDKATNDETNQKNKEGDEGRMLGMFKKNKTVTIESPLKGMMVPLEKVDDPVFGGKMMGDGIAIEPSEGTVVAPVNGKVETVFPTKHAIGITSDQGTEVLIHIGINTVELNGAHYETFVKAGDKVKVGDKLATFDIAAIKGAGYQVVTPVIITNTPDYKNIQVLANGAVSRGDAVLELGK